MSSSDDDDCLARTMTSERSDADFMECFGDASLRDYRGNPRDPFAPSNDDDYYFENHSVIDGEYVSQLVAPPEDEFPRGSRVFIIADLKEIKRTMGPYYFEEKMFRLMGGARRITGRVLRHHGDYTVVEFVLPLEEMFSGTHSRKLGGGGFRRQSLQHRSSITVSPCGTTILYPNVSSAAAGRKNGSRRQSLTVLDSTCSPSAALLDSTQAPALGSTVGGGEGGPSPSLTPSAPHHPLLSKLPLGGLRVPSGGGGEEDGGLQTSARRPPLSSRSPRHRLASAMASPRTPRGGAALLSPRTAAAQAEKITVAYTFHRSVLEINEDA